MSTKETKTIVAIDIIKSIINVYFDTFFVFYFFNVANYEIIPLAKYYMTMYIFIGIGFVLIRKFMKQNIKVPYFRIGISLQALYIAMIMLLKNNIINYIYLVAFVKGLAEALYFYPKNILNTEKISNEDRQKYSGYINVINNIIAVIIPLLLGIALTYIDYISLGKIFFILFIVMFIVSFYLKDIKTNKKNFDLKSYMKLINSNSNLKIIHYEPLLSGLTFSSGVMGIILTLFKIYNFKSNLSLGIVDSICAALCLITCYIFASKVKKFRKILWISGIFSTASLIIFMFSPTPTSLIIYLFTSNSFLTMMTLIVSHVITNLSNQSDLGKMYKAEFYCMRDVFYSISRTLGYFILLIICILFGKNIINYVLILPIISLIVETLLMNKVLKNLDL